MIAGGAPTGLRGPGVRQTRRRGDDPELLLDALAPTEAQAEAVAA